MLSRVVVHSEVGYAEWLLKAEAFYDEMPPAEAGEEMYRKYGCVQCHSIDGTANTGPSFKGIFGESHLMTDGSNVVVDENYIRDSILDPQAVIRDGYQGVMPTFQGKLEEKHIRWLIAFIKQLSGVEPEPVVEDVPVAETGEDALTDDAESVPIGEADDGDVAEPSVEDEASQAEEEQIKL